MASNVVREVLRSQRVGLASILVEPSELSKSCTDKTIVVRSLVMSALKGKGLLIVPRNLATHSRRSLSLRALVENRLHPLRDRIIKKLPTILVEH